MRTRALLIGCLLVVVLIAGCGGATSTSVQPTTFIVTRNISPLIHLEPFSKKITNQKDAQSLYNAALNLSPVGSGTLNCTTSSYVGLNYQMQFFSGTNVISNMNLDAATCRVLRIGKSDARQTNPAFLDLFLKTVGLPSLLPATSK